MEVVRTVIAERQRKLGSRVIEYRFHSNDLEENLGLQDTPGVSKRQKIVNEIYSSEQTYISQLSVIVDLFLKPIQARSLLPPDAVAVVFGNIEHILTLNRELLSYVRQKGPVDAFINMGPFLKVYATYANNYNNALEVVQAWERRSQDFYSFKLATEFRSECQSLKLESLLITPIQRIPRYRLLLQDLLRHTKETHPDYARLKDVCSRIDEMAEYINEHLRAQENTRRIMEIQKSLTGQNLPPLVAPGRRIIREGRLMKVCRNSNKAKERMFFLFSDMLIYARPNLGSSRTYECRCVLPLLHSTVCLVLGDIHGPGALFRVSNEDTSILVFSTNQDEVYSWIESIRKVIQDLMETVSYQNDSKSVSMQGKRPTSLSSGRPTGLAAEGGVEDGRCRSPSPSDKEEQLATAMLSPYPLTATIIASRSEEDLVGVERSESASSSSGEESSKPRPKRILHICATESPLGPVKEAVQVRDHHRREEGASGPSEGRQSRESSVQSNGEVERSPVTSRKARATEGSMMPRVFNDTIASVASGQVQVVQSRCCSLL